MNKLNRKMLFCCSNILIVLLCGLIVDSFASNEESKYQALFYPKGMPIKKGWDGKERETIYKYYAEVKVPDTHIIVSLYSERTVTGLSEDLYKVYLSVILEKEKEFIVKSINDVTKYISVFTEQVGNFHEMDGDLNFFKISARNPAINLNLWAVLAGTGSISSASDVFYLLNERDFSLIPILELKNTSQFSRQGVGREKGKNMLIYLADIDSNGSLDILLQEESFGIDESKNLKERIISPDISIYKYIEGEKRYTFFEKTSLKLPNSALLIKRSKKINRGEFLEK